MWLTPAAQNGPKLPLLEDLHYYWTTQRNRLHGCVSLAPTVPIHTDFLPIVILETVATGLLNF